MWGPWLLVLAAAALLTAREDCESTCHSCQTSSKAGKFDDEGLRVNPIVFRNVRHTGELDQTRKENGVDHVDDCPARYVGRTS